MRRFFSLVFLSASLLLANVFSAYAAPRVVATIRPVHSLVSMIMADVAKPQLLIDGVQDGHHFQLKPSQASMLHKAALVFQVDNDFEIFLNSIKSHTLGPRYVPLSRTRDERAIRSEHHWLNPASALKMLELIASELRAADPDNAEHYNRNLKFYSAKMQEKLNGWQAMLADTHYPATSLLPDYPTLDPLFHFAGKDTPTSLYHSYDHASTKTLADREISCVVATHGISRMLKKTAMGLSKPLLDTDIIGTKLPLGPELYFTLMDNLFREVQDCLTSH